jgi:DNA mismatch repair protein MutS
VLARAREVLALLEGEGAQMASALGRTTGTPRSDRASNRPLGPRVATVTVPAEQLALFNAPHPAIERLRALDVNTMTPLQALDHLARLIDEVRSDQSHA